jgi:hypothetical protein
MILFWLVLTGTVLASASDHAPAAGPFGYSLGFDGSSADAGYASVPAQPPCVSARGGDAPCLGISGLPALTLGTVPRDASSLPFLLLSLCLPLPSSPPFPSLPPKVALSPNLFIHLSTPLLPFVG